MADSDAVRARRYRAHRQGDHSLCRGPCGGRLTVLPTPPADPDTLGQLRAAVEDEFAGADSLSRGLALRLVDLAALNGPAGVAALRALGELVAAQRAAQPTRLPRTIDRRIS